jgi:hypothetical protein
MQQLIQDVRMKSVAGRATLGLALSAGAMSLVSVWFPVDRIWPGLAWAVVGCVAGLWAVQVMANPERSMGDVIAGVEAEPTAALPVPAPRLVRRGAIS